MVSPPGGGAYQLPTFNLSQVPPGSKVYLSGVFAGSFVVDRPVEIVGRGAVLYGNGTVLRIVASDVRVANLTIARCGRTGLDSGIWVENARNVTIVGISIEECLYPVMVYNSTGVKIVGSNIASFREVPRVTYGGGPVAMHELTQYFRGHGVYVWFSRGVVVEGSRFAHVLDGVYCDHAYGLEVVQNVFTSGSRYAVHLMYCEGVNIVGNSVRDYVVGFIPMYSSSVVINKNVVVDIRRVGGAAVVIFESDDVYICNNIITRNYLGVEHFRSPLRPGGRVVIVNNTFLYNNIAIKLDSYSTPAIYGNLFIENIRDVLPLFNNGALLYNESLKIGNFWGVSRGVYVARQRVFDKLLADNPHLELFVLTPAFTLLEQLFGVTYPRGGELVDKYPISRQVDISALYIVVAILAVVAYVWSRD